MTQKCWLKGKDAYNGMLHEKSYQGAYKFVAYLCKQIGKNVHSQYKDNVWVA